MMKDDDKQPREVARPKGAAETPRETHGNGKGRSGSRDSDTLTRALRSNYQSTVDEGVPDAFQDLINKLK